MSYKPFDGDYLCKTKMDLTFWIGAECEDDMEVPAGTLVTLGEWTNCDGKTYAPGRVATVISGPFEGAVRSAFQAELQPISPLEYLAEAAE